MSVATIDRLVEVATAEPIITAHRSTYRVRRWLPRRGTACRVGSGPMEFALTRTTVTPVLVAAPSRVRRARLTAAALAFDVVCLGGFFVLVWAIIAGLQPALQMTALY